MLAKELLFVYTRRAVSSIVSCRVVRILQSPQSPYSTRQLITQQFHSKCSRHIHPVMFPNSNVMFQPRRCKGHSHWQNVAHIKKEKNLEKAAIRAPLYVKMRDALRVGGADPKTNKKLEKVIQECTAANVPKTYIQGWINSFMESKSKGPAFVELSGPRGIVFVVKIAFDTTEVRNSINQKAKKVSVKPAKQQRWPSMFDQRGVIIVPVRNDMDVTNMDKYIEIAIEAGAEDVIVTDNDAQVPDVKSILKFHCDPLMVDRVAQEIQDTFELNVFSQEVELIPHSFLALETEEEADFCQAVHDKMYSIEEVLKVYDNTSLSAAD